MRKPRGRPFHRRHRTRRMPAATSRRGRSSATRTCTRRSRWTRARSVPPRAARCLRFAKGEEITASSGQPVKLSRPLDFLVVADHSDGIGFFPLILAGDPEIMADPTGPQVERHDQVRPGRGRRRSTSSSISARERSPKAIFPVARHAGLSRRRGTRPSRRRRRPTIRAASPRSSATSGPRTPAATTCTAT